MLRTLLRSALARWRSGSTRASADEAADAWIAAAHEHLSHGAAEQARVALEHALGVAPHDARVHHMLGVVLAQQGALAQARAALARALDIAPDSPDILADQGNLQVLGGCVSEASACYVHALRVDPQHTVAALAYARLLEQAGESDKAAEVLFAALRRQDAPVVVRALVSLLDRSGRGADATALCARILAADPTHGEARSGAGYMALKHRLDALCAARHFEQAVASVDDDPDLWSNFGIACQELGLWERAGHHYDRALSLAPEHAATRVHRALLRLSLGDYATGWDEYEHRRSAPDWVDPGYRVARCPPRAELRGRTVLVHAEQGIGDEILFASCLGDVLAEARAVIVECDDRLVALFARSYPGAQVWTLSTRSTRHAVGVADSAADVMLAAGSLPGRYRRSTTSFPRRSRYLVPDPAGVDRERRRLEGLGTGMKIGLSWRGGTNKTWGPVRSIALADLLPILRVPGATFVNLQYGEVAAELDELRHRHGVVVHHDAHVLADYDRTASLAAALDLIVSVDTAIVQLAGAMGCPVWAMVTLSPDWRYGIEGPTMPWYSSVRVFRQVRYREWCDVIEAVSSALAEFTAGRVTVAPHGASSC